jgi:hypothetical protein
MRNTTARLFVFLLTISAASVCYAQPSIVGMSIACSNDKVYTWYSDSTVTVGTSENLAAYEAPHRYTLPYGKTPADIVEIGIASTDHVYVWFNDRTVSSGTSTDLNKYQPRHPYKLDKTKQPKDVVGIDIACSDDRVYTWYDDRIGIGTSEDLDKYTEGPSIAFGYFPKPSERSYVGIGIARNDHVYAWFKNNTASSGTSRNMTTYRQPYEYVRGPGPCDISADTPKLKGRTVFGVGIRGPSCQSNAEIVVRLISVGAMPGVLLEKRVTGSNFEVPLTYQCKGKNRLTVLTEVEVQGRTVRSARFGVDECFEAPVILKPGAPRP